MRNYTCVRFACVVDRLPPVEVVGCWGHLMAGALRPKSLEVSREIINCHVHVDRKGQAT